MLNLCYFQQNLVKPYSSFIDTYYPSEEWRKATPEFLGLDSEKLGSMNQTIFTQDIGIDSIQIIRYGYLGYEYYSEYYNHSEVHLLWSCTKSVLSILIGIAHTEGFISNLDEPILNIFTERTFANLDSRKEAITIRHLLKMQSGLEWSYENFLSSTVDKDDYAVLTNTTDTTWENWPKNFNHDSVKMLNSSDRIQYILDKPMVNNPGVEFSYSSGNSHLLSAILEKKTGLNAESFAKQYLFTPLNITNYVWFNDSQGITIGGSGLWMTPFDMCKIGYLVLNEGLWNGIQVFPSTWVDESIQDYNPSTGYGYHWWVKTDPDYFYAQGYGGQNIFVLLDESMIAVITASEYPHYGNIFPLFTGFILNSIVENKTITETTTSTTTTTTTATVIPSHTSTSDESTTTTSVSSSGWPTPLLFLGIILVSALKLRRRR